MHIYSMRNLKHSYGNHPTLNIESLGIPRGSVTGLIGPNGSGKSTLLKILAFLELPAAGELCFEDENAKRRETELRMASTLLLQEPYLLRRTVEDNIRYGLKLRGIQDEDASERTEDALGRVGLAPEKFMRRPWFRLSGGEVQRVALAVRLALRPKVLLLDEPTANVDESSAVLIKDAVWHAWRDWGTTIVVATHDLIWLHEVATKIVSLYRGRVIGDGAENLIQGAWRSRDGYAELRVGGGVVRAKAEGPFEPACAILNPSMIAVSKEAIAASPDTNVLQGTLTQMSIERASGHILGVADCGGLLLRARFPIETARQLNLYPGLPVQLSFSVSSLKFL